MHRVSLGLTQEVLAERAGLSRRGIADLERGARSAPYRDTIERLATALALSESQRQTFFNATRRSPGSRRPRLHISNPGADGSNPGADGSNPGADGSNPGADGLASVERAAPRHNLPVQPTSFVGRESEQMRLAAMLESSPLVTLVGPGGVGKTRLALEVAASVTELFPEGVWLVELAPLSDGGSNLVPQKVAAVLGVQQHSGVDPATSLATWLRSRRMLLVLDNCEHVVEACAQLASQLAHTCPQLRMLATSREVLGIAGETLWRVSPLAVHPAETSSESEAVRLFCDRARAAAPGFELTEQNTLAVLNICQQLDGMPLALELAAARLRSLAVVELAAGLDQRFELLTGGSRDALPRHRTLRALVDWSYDLLNEAERALFQNLSVFSGGWTLDAAQAISETTPGATLDLLGQLVDKSLVRTEPHSDGTLRYRILETLRQYASEQLERTGQAEEVRRRHALFFADVIVRRWGPFWFSEHTKSRLASVERDYENFRTSLRWLVDKGDTRAAERLAAALTTYWVSGLRLQEGRHWLEIVLDMSHDLPMSRQSRLRLFLAASLAHYESMDGNHVAGLARLEAFLPAIREYADPYIVAWAVHLTGLFTWTVRHDFLAARAISLEGLRLAEATGITHIQAAARIGLARVELEAGHYARAEQLYLHNLAMDEYSRPRHALGLARLRFAQHNHAAAARLLEELTDQDRSSRMPIDAILAWTILSWARVAQGDLHRARAAAIRAVEVVRDHMGRTTSFGLLAGSLEAFAMISAAAGQPARALRLAANAAALRESYTTLLVLTPTPAERALLEQSLKTARQALSAHASQAAWTAGKSLAPEAAIEEALAVPEKAPSHTAPDGLTPREREVLTLAAQGLTNRQIADVLVIAEGTARIHVEHILTKLNVHSRAQLVAWAVHHDSYGSNICLSPDADLGTRA